MFGIFMLASCFNHILASEDNWTIKNILSVYGYKLYFNSLQCNG